jgi:hypothetical protein
MEIWYGYMDVARRNTYLTISIGGRSDYNKTERKFMGKGGPENPRTLAPNEQ